MTDTTASRPNESVEMLLWQLRAVQAPLPEREVRFHPVRRWRFDACFRDRMLAIEVDGGSWVGGRHTSGQGFENDCMKLSTAASMGYRVMRFTPRMIRDGVALSLLLAALEWRAAA